MEAIQQPQQEQQETGRGSARGNGKDKPEKQKKDVAGRKDGEGQEAVPDPKALKEGLPGVIKALVAADEAKDQANKKVKALAKKSGFLASVVRAVAKARSGEGFEDKYRYAEQLELAFVEVSK